MLGSRQPGAVTAHHGLGGKGVHRLGPTDPGQQIEAVDGGSFGRQGLHHVVGCHRLQKADHRDTLGELCHLFDGRRLHPRHQVSPGQGGGGIGDHRGPGLLVGGIGEASSSAGTGLHDDVDPRTGQLCRHLGNDRHPCLAREGLLDYGEFHGSLST